MHQPAVRSIKPRDFQLTGPGTVAGRYMRMFWQPIYQSSDLPAGKARPVKIMNVDYTIYRGTDGVARLTQFRCPHRGTQLSVGWVEGDAIRCRYHGWKFDGSGQCVAQPPEPNPFTSAVQIRTYPCREYLGFVFAFLGEGEPPAFPRYPDFEDFDGILEHDSYFRGCNYFNNVDNGGDHTHSGFTHRNNPGAFDGFEQCPVMDAEESDWGITIYARWPEQERVSQFGMPNIMHHKGQPSDPKVAIFREFLAWWVPIDDDSHMQFTVARVEVSQEKAAEYLERRDRRVAARKYSSVEITERVLKGEIDLDDLDPAECDLLRVQDNVVQIGQGVRADYGNERLGRSDRTIVVRRKLWTRELEAMLAGQPLKEWKYDPDKQQLSRGALERVYEDQRQYRE